MTDGGAAAGAAVSIMNTANAIAAGAAHSAGQAGRSGSTASDGGSASSPHDVISICDGSGRTLFQYRADGLPLDADATEAGPRQ